MSSENYNYKSPIAMYESSAYELMDKMEDGIICEVRKTIGYNIDKARLVGALKYDREQYDKGYQDGKHAAYTEIESKKIGHWVCLDDDYLAYGCSECKCVSLRESKYCPECGAFMKVESSSSWKFDNPELFREDNK